MSYWAPWERGVGTADTMPLRDIKVPGLVPNVDGDELNTKKARRHHSQHSQRQWRRKEKASRKAQSREDEGRCLDVLAEVVEMNCQELSMLS